jgi:hypothetical protein
MPTIEAAPSAVTPKASPSCGIITLGADRNAYW